MALLLLSSALVIVLGEVVGSLSLSLVIVGAIYVIIATTLYFTAIHSTLRQWQRRMDTVYDVSLTIEQGEYLSIMGPSIHQKNIGRLITSQYHFIVYGTTP